MTLEEIKTELAEFPITSHLENICDSLKNSPSRFLVLTAETAAGKSTILPLALMEKFSGKIIMTEPRRIATLGVANRLADLCGQEVGERVGYKIHLENKVSADTQLEVVTEAILVRQLQNDPALENYNVVVLDEFHERSVNTDLALAFLKEAMQLRDDLFVIIMSATIDTEKLQKYCDAPVLKIPGRQFPVEIVYRPGKSVVDVVENVLEEQCKQKRPFDRLRDRDEFKDRERTGVPVLRQAQEPQNEGLGNILVFLPGISDIRKAYDSLLQTGLFVKDNDNELLILHSSISLEEQKRVITPLREGQQIKRRVILSSAIAETSLTVPGVSVVIDSGLARVNRLDINTGMEKLTTENESEFSAEQRAGRAGRLGPGKCIRLWEKSNKLVKELAPEILRADLVPLVLECRERGVYNIDGIDWLDKPNKNFWNESAELLQELGMLDDKSHITTKGKAALTLGVHPRLAGIALESFDSSIKHLSEEGKKILLKFSTYEKSSSEIQKRFINDLERRLNSCGYIQNAKPDFLILCGYPDRLAQRISEAGSEPAEYKFAGGRQAKLYDYKGSAPLWLVAPDVMAGEKSAVIFDFVAIDENKIAGFLERNCKVKLTCKFENGTLQKLEQKCFGAIVLSSKKTPATEQDYALAWVNEIKEKGLECLPKNPRIESFLLRAEFVEQQKVSGQNLEERLCQNAKEWLVPFLAGKKTLTAETVYDALYWYLEGSQIDKLAPEYFVLENGRRCKVKYEKLEEIRPVIEIIIQRIFGCFKTPEICGKKVLLRLLSPASRPLQVTEDLENFWTGAWPQICKEMKGRYPKHNWDYKVVEKD